MKIVYPNKKIRAAALAVVLTALAIFASATVSSGALDAYISEDIEETEIIPEETGIIPHIPHINIDTLKTGAKIVKYMFADTSEIVYVDSGLTALRRVFWSGAVTGADWVGKDESGLLPREIKNEGGLPNESGFLVIHYRGAPGWGRLSLCDDDGSEFAVNECLWGAEVWTEGVPVINETSRLTMTDSITLFTVTPAAPAHLSLRAPASAAMMISVDGKIKNYEEFWNGMFCDIPLLKAAYTIGIKPLYDRPLTDVPLLIGLHPIDVITGSDPQSVRLTPRQKRIFKFEVKSKEFIGVAASAGNGSAETVIFDTEGNIAASGTERIYAELDKGEYFLMLSAQVPPASVTDTLVASSSVSAQPAGGGADIRLRVFGLDNPPVDPPQERLQWIMKGGVGERPVASKSESGGMTFDASEKKITAFGDNELTLAVSKSGAARVVTDARHRSIGDGWTRVLTGENKPRDITMNLRGSMHTDRYAYSSKDSVFVKGYVREVTHGMIKFAPEDQPLSYMVRVRDPAWTRADHPVTLSELGGFDMMFTLGESFTMPGEYALSLLAKLGEREVEIARTSFFAAAYHPPKFKVGLTGAPRVINNKPVEIGVSVFGYKSGKSAANRDVVFRADVYRRSYRPRGFPGFVFSSDGRTCGAPSECLQSVLEINAKTNDSGIVNVAPDPRFITDGEPAEIIIEAVVTDTVKSAGQNAGDSAAAKVRVISAAARHAVTALPPFALGMRANRHITSGSTISARIAAAGMNDSLIAGQKVTASLSRVVWKSKLADGDFVSGDPEYVVAETVEPVAKRDLLTKGNPINVEFKNQRPGVYVLEVSSSDDLGRVHSVSAEIFLAGNKPQIWKASEPPALEIISDRNIYEPGQQAKILLRIPRGNAQALVTAMRPDGNLQYRWVNIRGGQGSFSQDIRQDMAPQLPMSVFLMPAADAEKPEIVMKSATLPVMPVANMLDVRLSHANAAAPGAALDVTISVKDVQGRGRAGEVALVLVSDDITPYRRGGAADIDPLEAFIAKTECGVNESEADTASAGVRANRSLMPKQKTYYRNMTVKVDRSGRAAVRIPVPKTEGTYTLKAIAASGPDRFGAARSRVSVRKQPR